MGSAGPLLTKTLLLLSQRAAAADPGSGGAGEADGVGDVGTAQIVAYDKATGEVVGGIDVPGQPSGTPMSYFEAGKQYIVVATGGGPQAGLVAFALP